jgi:co-chaperonin GroES (HSP10)
LPEPGLLGVLIPWYSSGTVDELRLLADHVLVRPLTPPAMDGSIHIPQSAKQDRYGEVVKCGPGDKVTQHWCSECGRDLWPVLALFPLPENEFAHRYGYCIVCNVETPVILRHHMNVKPGDRILYGPRPWATVRLEGVDYEILHEEQHILAVLE